MIATWPTGCLANKLQFSRPLPGLLVLVVNESRQIVADTLRRLAEIWKLLLELDEVAYVDHWARLLLRALPWTGSAWVRRQLTLLAEYSFELAPSSV